jgi:hypothetical protein
MESGKTRYFTYHQAPPFNQGQRVRIENGTLVAGWAVARIQARAQKQNGDSRWNRRFALSAAFWLKETNGT